MSCIRSIPLFRLLDHLVGWDPQSLQNLTGVSDADGLRLANRLPNTELVHEVDVSSYLLPARLAKGCVACNWLLLTPIPPKSRLLYQDACSDGWQALWEPNCDGSEITHGSAVAMFSDRIAVADSRAKRVWVWIRRGEKKVAEIMLPTPGPMAFTPWGELLVVNQEDKTIRRFDRAGNPVGVTTIHYAGNECDIGRINRIGIDAHCRIWLVTEVGDELYRLWVANEGSENFYPADLEALRDAFTLTGITAISSIGFCLQQQTADGIPLTHCYSWYGRPLLPGVIINTHAQLLEQQGQLLTLPIDSGIPRCLWHRIRLDANIPAGTSISIAVSCSEEKQPIEQGQADPGWETFAHGIPHPNDWQTNPDNASDFLIQQPPGRYLFVRIRMIGNGFVTPVIRRIQIDLPRVTSLQHLPAVYQDNPQAEDFTERFLSLFDASVQDMDEIIERYSALFGVENVHPDVLPWLGSFLDIVFDPAWDDARRRKILNAAPALYRKRGTLAGLKEAVQLVFDVTPSIQELALERNWGAVNHAQLNSLRLFGRSRARFRLGSSALSSTPLKSYGDPDNDPLAAEAFRFRILIPPGQLSRRTDQKRLQRLIDNQKPAHTIASMRLGGRGFVIGTWSSVGIDSVFTSLPPPVLGNQDLRLNRMSILWHSRRGRIRSTRVGETAAVGVNMVME